MPTLPVPAAPSHASLEAVAAVVWAAFPPGQLLAPEQLAALVTVVAAEPAWRPLVRHDPERRWYTRLYRSAEVEVWLLAWSAGQDTRLHDHGGACGAFHVVEGVLTEDWRDGAVPDQPLTRRRHAPGAVVGFGPAYVHNVADPGPADATSVHAYSPAARPMRFYDLGDRGGPERTGGPRVDPPQPRPSGPRRAGERERPVGHRSIDELLVTTRQRLHRLSAREAAAAAAGGALLVDLRPLAQRQAHGEIPGATVIDRNVLEWRLDPASDARIPEASYDLQVVLFCQEGFASSLAAATLQELGLTSATDVVGGFEAWAAAGLPIERASR